MIITVGTSQFKNFREFQEFVFKNRIDVVIDVRAKPFSWNEDFSMPNLRKNFSNYRWRRSLGGSNILKKMGKYDEEKRKEAIKEVEKLCRKGKRVLLMCAEKNFRECHRYTELPKFIKGCEIFHLSPDKSKLVKHGELPHLFSGGSLKE